MNIKSNIGKKKLTDIEPNSLKKILSGTKERHLQYRQQQILNIVNDNFLGATKKVNLDTKPEVASTGINSTSLIRSYNNKSITKIKFPLEIPKPPKQDKINTAIRKKALVSKESYNLADKQYFINPYLKNARLSKNFRIKNNLYENSQTKNEFNDLNEILKEKTTVENKDDMEIVKTQNKSQKEIIRQRIEKAVQEKKIFLVRADIPYLDKIFLERGWVKKYESSKTRKLTYGNFTTLEQANSLGEINNIDNSLNEKAFIYQELKNITPNFIWDCRNDFVQWKGNIQSDTYLNRLEKSLVYTSKLGLALYLENFYWFYEEGVADVSFPRCYNISEEKEAFIEDYRNTAVVSFLKWFKNQVESNYISLNRNFSYTMDKAVKFAIERCEDIIAITRNENLDHDLKQISSKDWDIFIDFYTKNIHKQDSKDLDVPKKENDFDNIEISELYNKVSNILEQIKYADSQYEMNGIRNIWILKPNLSCCGYGIMMMHKLNNILTKVNEASKNYFIVQKYIEKPLLIKNTKFDVRQWFLITNSFPLTIWIYKESLLRFSSRPFTFDNYHEIIHICNTAIQRKYADQKDPVRDLNWDCDMLNQYLKETFPQCSKEPWYDIIYPKMCQAIIATMLAAQNRIDPRMNSFELYGADFVIMEDLSVWLIEINTNPRMHPPSSRITERLYPEVLDSLMKVILDYPFDKEADTGNFILVYQQKIDTSIKYNEIPELSLVGEQLKINILF